VPQVIGTSSFFRHSSFIDQILELRIERGTG
jgi:hypothetical protein